jgi:hypothetical protein
MQPPHHWSRENRSNDNGARVREARTLVIPTKLRAIQPATRSRYCLAAKVIGYAKIALAVPDSCAGDVLGLVACFTPSVRYHFLAILWIVVVCVLHQAPQSHSPQRRNTNGRIDLLSTIPKPSLDALS